MAIDVSTICLDDCFALSIGILSPTDLIHQYPWVKTAWLLMSARFIGMNIFHCRLEFCRHRNLTHQFPWAKANMAIDVSKICWDEYFSLSIGIFVVNEIP